MSKTTMTSTTPFVVPISEFVSGPPPLHPNVIMGAPLSTIQYLYDLDPDQDLTEELIWDAFLHGCPGVLTFLVDKFKSQFDCSTMKWGKFVKTISRRVSRHDIRKESETTLTGLMEAFPELICGKSSTSTGWVSPLELCFESKQFNAATVKELAGKIIDNKINGFTLSQQFGVDLDDSRLEVLAIILSKVNHFICSKYLWTSESISQLIRLVFQSSNNIKSFTVDSRSVIDDVAAGGYMPEHSFCLQETLASLSHQGQACPTIESITFEYLEGATYPWFSVLPYMHRLIKLDIHTGDALDPTLIDWRSIGVLVTQGTLEILMVFSTGMPCPPADLYNCNVVIDQYPK